MFCTRCGSPLHENQKYCNQCGTFIRATHTVPITPAPVSIHTPANRAGRALVVSAFVSSGLSILLSLIFVPSICSAFSGMEVSISDDEAILVFITAFLYLIIKLLGVILVRLASALLYILPGLMLAVTGLALGIVSRVQYKVRSFKLAPILVPVVAVWLQLVMLAVCFGASSSIPIVWE